MEVSKEDLPSIYCDMDMVLCDFLKGAEKVIGMPFPLANKQGRWEKITDTKDFWANLDWIPGAKKIVQNTHFFTIFQDLQKTESQKNEYSPTIVPH